MSDVLHSHLPSVPWMVPALARLPGVVPLEMRDWLSVDEVFAAQMALRDRLLAERRAAVYAMTPAAEAAAAALLALILDQLGPAYRREGDGIMRPDGVRVPLGADPPLVTAARLVQEDLCLHQPGPMGEHVLSGAVLCFPASWTLSEKIGRPLSAIHAPVAPYDAQMAARVQRLFDAIRPDRPLWRQNALVYADPALHQPRPEAAPRRDAPEKGRYLRSEKQCFVRVPGSDAVVFTIHTYVLPLEALPPAARRALPHAPSVT
jgi:dimethylamine monooxygenase subunit A